MKNKTLIVLICSISINSFLFSQKLITEDPDKLKVGIYQNFKEFVFNSPSISLDYSLEYFQINYINILKGAGSLPCVKLEIDKKTGNNIGKVFGLCDGEKVYLTKSDEKLDNKTEFYKLLDFGRYCYYKAIIDVYNGYSSHNDLADYAIDLNNGDFIFLNNKAMKSILESDSVLSEEYRNTKKSDSVNREFLQAYSSAHKDEINIKPELLYLDSLLRRGENDTSLNDYYNRIMTYTEDPLIENFIKSEGYYGNGNYRYFGLKAKHEYSINNDYYYRIGTWYYFYKNGKLKKIANYNLLGNLDGVYLEYDENGVVTKSEKYLKGQLK